MYGSLFWFDSLCFTVLEVYPDGLRQGETGLIDKYGVIEDLIRVAFGKDRTIFH